MYSMNIEPETGTAPSLRPAGGMQAALNRVDLYLLALVGIVCVINLPYWDPRFMVGHDTKNTYLVFHYFYNHLVWYSELPHWLPFGEYGYNSLFYQLCDFSPCTYLAGLLGWVLRMRDTLLLFKLSAFGDQLVFLLGLHLLSRRLYKQRRTAFLVCLMGVASVVWTWQIYWCLRQFYLIPLVLYFYHTFLEDRLSWAFWAGILTMLISLVGGLPYWAPIYAFLMIIMTLILLPSHWRSFACLLRPSRADAALMSLIVLCAVSLGYVLTTCLAGLHNYAPGRSLSGMKTHLQTYLTYIAPVWGQLHSFIDGTLPDRPMGSNQPADLTLYVGLLSIVGFVVACLRVRNIWFYSLAGGMAAVALLADSGAFSWLLYRGMPGLDKFRHLGLLLEVVKVLLLLAGGFGIERILAALECRERLAARFRPALFLSLLAALVLVLDMLVSSQAYLPEAWSSPMVLEQMLPQGGGWVIVRLAVWALALTALFVVPRIPRVARFLPAVALPVLISCACFIDMACFQAYHWTNRSSGQYAGHLELEPLKFIEARTWEPSEDALQKDRVIRSSPGGAYLAFYANALQYDLCKPFGRVDIFPKGVHELVTARGGLPSQQTIWETFLPPDDAELLAVLGCTAPKVRFVTRAEFGGSDQEITAMIRASTSLDTTVIIRGSSGQQASASQPADDASMAFRPRLFNANRLDMDIAVTPGMSGWLVFADAYDPHWRAYVNGKETPVLEAYRAFKAVSIGGGDALVSFRFENSGQNYAMGVLMLVGILLAIGSFVGLVWQTFGCSGSCSGTECSRHDTLIERRAL